MSDSKYRTKMRSNLCEEISKDFIGREVSVCGWVNKRRDHGKLIFIDLRDFSGIVQIVLDPKSSMEAYTEGKKVRNEYVLQATGTVRKRSDETINPSIKTGDIEIIISNLRVLSESKTPPFMLEHSGRVDENTRLKYRYIDLRTEKMQKSLRLRSKITAVTREFFNLKGFVEIETPILAKSTPEGARDFLVPSRINPGKFYALPQSPQLFKQILMFSGFDRVYQIARCFRDEDLRADRQPEFTQIDLEMTFVEADDVINIIEGLFENIFKKVFNKKLTIPFKRISWHESIEYYGTDKPDIRYGLKINDITKIFSKSGLKIFKKVIDSGGFIKCIVIPDYGKLARKDLDELVDIAKSAGAGGLVWIKVNEDGSMQSPVAKFLSGDEKKALTDTLSLKKNNIVLIVADSFKKACGTLGELRVHIAKKIGLTKKDDYEIIWIYDFPLFEWDEKEERLSPVHHPFTSPDRESIKLLEKEPLKARSLAYDIIINGQEIGGGSIRINDSSLQQKIFKLLKIDKKTAKENFGFLTEALSYGAPPHGGIALGMDRLASPSDVKKEQLDEVFIKTIAAEEE